MLEWVRFQNIRALADIEISLQPFTIIVGPNACGKTTALNEITRLCNMCKINKNNVLSGPGFEINRSIPACTSNENLSILWSGKNKYCNISISVKKREGIDPDWFLRTTVDVRHKNNSLKIDHSILQSKKETITNFNNIISSFPWNPQHLSIERRMILRDSPIDVPTDRLDPSGFGLPTLLLHLAANDPDAYAALQKDLAAVVPDFKRLYVKKVKTEQNQDAYRLDLVFGGAGRIPAEDASEGTLFALGLLTAIHAPEMPEIVLLDDLDRGLHLSAQYEVIQAIRRVQERRPELQVICTSHSPVLVDSFKAEEVRVMALNKDGHACIKPLTALPEYERWKGALRSGELWANFGEKWVTGDAG